VQNDLNVFNIDTLLWEPVKVRGTTPPQRWSHTMTSLSDNDSKLWLLWGCTPPVYAAPLFLLVCVPF
jgi:hypothetical protein